LLKSQSLRTNLSNFALRKINSPKIYVKRITDNGKDILKLIQNESKQNSIISEKSISQEELRTTLNRFYLKPIDSIKIENISTKKSSLIKELENHHSSISKLVQKQLNPLNKNNILDLTQEKDFFGEGCLSTPNNFKRVSSRNNSQNEG